MRGETRAIGVAQKRQRRRRERERVFDPGPVGRRGRPRGRRRGSASAPERRGQRVVVVASRREIRDVGGGSRRFGFGSFATETPTAEGIVGDVRRAEHGAGLGWGVLGEESRAMAAASEDARAVRSTRGEERDVARRDAERRWDGGGAAGVGVDAEETREGGVDGGVVEGGVGALDAEGGVDGGGDDVARVRDGEPGVGVVVGGRGGVGERAKEEDRAVAGEVELAIR